MTMVCKGWYPAKNPDGPKNGNAHLDGFYLQPTLKQQIDPLIQNITNDWDFTIIISGSGEVRVGKSVLAMQIAAYIAHQMKEVHGIKVPYNLKQNYVFEGKDLIKKGNELGSKHPYSCLIYDEAGSDLDTKKVMTAMTRNVLDFFRECGQYNLFNFLVIPDFFDLPKGIAMTRSIFLIDVNYRFQEDGYMKRGIYRFFSKKRKKWLYMKGKKDLDYNCTKENFYGRFPLFYPLPEKEYRALKQKALKKRENTVQSKYIKQRNLAWWMLHKEFGLAQAEIARRMTTFLGEFVHHTTVSDAIIGQTQSFEVREKKNNNDIPPKVEEGEGEGPIKVEDPPKQIEQTTP